MNRLFALLIFILPNTYLVKSNEPFDKIADMQAMSIEYSDLIFLGEIINYNSRSDTICFRIFEKFKGSYRLDSVYVIRSFDENIDFHPYDGLWLVYLEMQSDSSMHFCRGGLSRSLKHPEWVFVMTYIESFVSSGFDTTSLRVDAITDWFLELEKLKRLTPLKVSVKEKTSISKLMIVVIFCSVLNFLLLVYLLIKIIARR